MGCNASKSTRVLSSYSVTGKQQTEILEKYKTGITRIGNGGSSTANLSSELNDQKEDAPDPRLPLSKRQLYAVTRSWKAITRNMALTSLNMFVR